MQASAVQPAVVHPPTKAALERGRTTALRKVAGAAGAAVLGGLALLVATAGVEEGERASAPQSVAMLVGVVACLAAGVLVCVGGWHLWRAWQIGRVLAVEPWHVHGPFRWREVQIGSTAGGNRLDFTLVAVGRRGQEPLKGWLSPLPPGWNRPGVEHDRLGDVRSGAGGDIWVAGPVGGRHVLGLADGSGLGLLRAAPRLYADRLGRQLDQLGP